MFNNTNCGTPFVSSFALHRASDPFLSLKIEFQPLEQTTEDWDLVEPYMNKPHFQSDSKELQYNCSIPTKILTKVCSFIKHSYFFHL